MMWRFVSGGAMIHAMRWIYVISDLHLGGATGFQMCPPEARRRLATFVNETAKAHPGDTLELVINGDFVDFLAEKAFEPFSPPDRAIQKLERIVHSVDEGELEGRRVFAALRAWAQAGHHLTLLLGNHDVELSLPEVRRVLAECLTGGAPSRLELLLDGEAYVRPGLLIEHGNRYDGWNAVAHGRLRAYRSAASRGERRWPFLAPPGSRLVANVMNRLKTDYPFIDLLKPETTAMLPILCALEPEIVRELRRLAPLRREAAAVGPHTGRAPRAEAYVAGGAGRASRELAFIGAGASPEPDVPSEGHVDGVDEDLTGEVECAADVERTDRLLREAEGWLVELSTPSIGVRVEREHAEIAASTLSSAWSLIHMLRQGREDSRRWGHLRRALVAQRESIGTTFALDVEDSTYLEQAKRLAAGGSRIVVFGHTHLAKRIPFAPGSLYLNTGTWCHTIQLDEVLYTPGENDDAAVGALRAFVADMRDNRLGSWAQLRTCCARICIPRDGDSPVEADLCQVDDAGTATPLR